MVRVECAGVSPQKELTLGDVSQGNLHGRDVTVKKKDHCVVAFFKKIFSGIKRGCQAVWDLRKSKVVRIAAASIGAALLLFLTLFCLKKIKSGNVDKKEEKPFFAAAAEPGPQRLEHPTRNRPLRSGVRLPMRKQK